MGSRKELRCPANGDMILDLSKACERAGKKFQIQEDQSIKRAVNARNHHQKISDEPENNSSRSDDGLLDAEKFAEGIDAWPRVPWCVKESILLMGRIFQFRYDKFSFKMYC
jgi:hypothetical protein